MIRDGLISFLFAIALYTTMHAFLSSNGSDFYQRTQSAVPPFSGGPLGSESQSEGAARSAEVTIATANKAAESFSEKLSSHGMPFALRECQKVLLDVGSGSGAMIQRLYDGHKRTPNAFFSEAWREHLALLFGHADMRHGDVCAVLWEPIDSLRLRRIVGRYQALGRRVHWFRRPAWAALSGDVGDGNNATFYSTLPRSFQQRKSPIVKFAYVGSLDKELNESVAGGPITLEDLPLHDIVRFVETAVSPSATVLLTIDAPGAEHRLVNGLFRSGALCRFVDSLVLQHPNPDMLHLQRGDATDLTSGDYYRLGWKLHKMRCQGCKTVVRMSLPFSWPFNKKAGEELGVGIYRCHLPSWRNYFFSGGRCLW
jgi:hypothetical protein